MAVWLIKTPDLLEFHPQLANPTPSHFLDKDYILFTNFEVNQLNRVVFAGKA